MSEIKKTVLLVIDENGNPMIHSIHDSDEEARRAALPFKADDKRNYSRPMLQAIFLEADIGPTSMTASGNREWGFR